MNFLRILMNIHLVCVRKISLAVIIIVIDFLLATIRISLLQIYAFQSVMTLDPGWHVNDSLLPDLFDGNPIPSDKKKLEKKLCDVSMFHLEFLLVLFNHSQTVVRIVAFLILMSLDVALIRIINFSTEAALDRPI